MKIEVEALEYKVEFQTDRVLKEIDLKFSKMQFSMMQYTVGLVIAIGGMIMGLLKIMQ